MAKTGSGMKLGLRALPASTNATAKKLRPSTVGSVSFTTSTKAGR